MFSTVLYQSFVTEYRCFSFSDFSPKFIRTKRSYLQIIGNASSSHNSISSLPGNEFYLFIREFHPLSLVGCLRKVIDLHHRQMFMNYDTIHSVDYEMVLTNAS